jgi:hypothetical protein
MKPEHYTESKRCENCAQHEEDWKFGSLLFRCRLWDFTHQNSDEMNCAVCEDWEKEY